MRRSKDTPKPDYAKIARLERELGIVPTPEPVIPKPPSPVEQALALRRQIEHQHLYGGFAMSATSSFARYLVGGQNGKVERQAGG